MKHFQKFRAKKSARACKKKYFHTGCKIQFYLPGTMFSHSAVLAGSHSSSHTSARIRGFKPNRSTHSIPCKCACVAWVPMPPAQRPAPGPPRRAAGPEMAMLADGRAPGECRAHRAPPERRQRHAARVEPVARGGTNGGEVALRPPFTPRKSAAKSSSDRAAAPPAERNP